MADNRYLKRQHQTWHFVLAVPRPLRGRFVSRGRNGKPGKPLSRIVISLKTQSIKEAQDRRWPLVKEWREHFQEAASGTPLSLDRIEAEASEEHRATLEHLEHRAKHRKLAVRVESEALKEALFELYDDVLAGADPEDRDVDAAITELTEFDFIGHRLAAVQRRLGLTLDPESEPYRLLGQALTRALIGAYERRLRALRGEPSDPPATFLGPHGINPVTLQPERQVVRPQVQLRSGAGMRFSEGVAKYVDEIERDPGAAIKPHTLRQRVQTVFRFFQDFTRDAPLASIDKLTATAFLDEIAKLDPEWNWIPNAATLSLAEIVQRSASRPGRLSNRTVNSYVTGLSAFFNWCDKRGYFDGRNPFQRQRRNIAKGTGWRAFDAADLNKLFGAPLLRNTPARERIGPAQYTFKNALMWIPLVALFSGMRSNEICQMRTADVQQREGIWLFSVTDDSGEEGDQSLKSDAARRIVPVHSELIRCGFIEYLKALPPNGQLWPALKPGGANGAYNHYLARRFTEYRRACGVTGKGRVFHSFRKNCAQALKDARCTPAEIAELIGHEQGFTLSVYAPMQLPLPTLQELIERVRYPGLKLDHLHRAAGK